MLTALVCIKSRYIYKAVILIFVTESLTQTVLCLNFADAYYYYLHWVYATSATGYDALKRYYSNFNDVNAGIYF